MNSDELGICDSDAEELISLIQREVFLLTKVVIRRAIKSRRSAYLDLVAEKSPKGERTKGSADYCDPPDLWRKAIYENKKPWRT